MTQTLDGESRLDKILHIIDEHRGRLLETRRLYEKDDPNYQKYSSMLKILNGLKRQISDVFDADQLSLGL